MPVSSSANTAQLIKDFLAAIERSDFNVVLRIIRAAPQLLDRVFDPNTLETPLLIAAAKSNSSIVKCMIEQGANPDVKNKSGETPLMIAILRDDFECVRFIVRDHHQTLNDQRENGDTALILATKKGNIQIIKEIMKYQPNIFLTNENGDDAWETACESIEIKSTQPIIRSLIDNFTHVFISHDWCVDNPSYTSDIERLDKLNRQLRHAGLKTWYPMEQLIRGGDIHASIETGLKNTCVILFFLTKRYRDKVNNTIPGSRRMKYSTAIQDNGYYEFQKIKEYLHLFNQSSSSAVPEGSSIHEVENPQLILIPILWDPLIRYFKEGSKDGEMGNFLYGNHNFFEFSGMYGDENDFQEVNNLEDEEVRPVSPIHQPKGGNPLPPHLHHFTQHPHASASSTSTAHHQHHSHHEAPSTAHHNQHHPHSQHHTSHHHSPTSHHHEPEKPKKKHSVDEEEEHQEPMTFHRKSQMLIDLIRYQLFH